MNNNLFVINLTNREPFIEILSSTTLTNSDFDSNLMLREHKDLQFRVGGFFNARKNENNDRNMFSDFLKNNVLAGDTDEFMGDVVLVKIDENSKVNGFTEEEVTAFIGKIFKYMETNGEIEVTYEDTVESTSPIDGSVLSGGYLLLNSGKATIDQIGGDRLIEDVFRKYLGHFDVIPCQEMWEECGVHFALLIGVEANKSLGLNPYGMTVMSYKEKELRPIYGNVLMVKVNQGPNGEGILCAFTAEEEKKVLKYVNYTKEYVESNMGSR